MKVKTKKILSKIAKISTGTLVFLGTIVGGYLLTPNKVKYLDIEVQQAKKSNFELFLQKLQEDVGITRNDDEPQEVEVEKFLKANFNNINFAYKLSDSTVYNTLNVNGELDLKMHGLDDINFNLEADINYNGKELPLEIGLFKKVAYFGLKDLRLKMTEASAEDVFNMLNDLEDSENFRWGDVYSDLNDFLKEKIDSSFDISSLVSSLTAVDENSTSSVGFNIGDEVIRGTDIVFPISINFDEKDPTTQQVVKSETLYIEIVSASDYTIKKVDLGVIPQVFKDFKISGSIDFEYVAMDDFVTPEVRHPNYNYVDVFNYNGWLRKIVNLFKEDQQKIGINFEADLDYKGTKMVNNVEVPDEGDIARVVGSINVDFSQLLDFSKYYRADVEEIIELPDDDRELIQRLKDDVTFNLQLDLIGQNDIKYANLILAYQQESGYIIFNEKEDGNSNLTSVMKAAIDTNTVNAIMEKVPNLLAAISGEDENASLSTLFGSLLGDDGIGENLKKGDYSFVLDMLDNLSNDDSKINVGLDLSSLNIGEDARVDIVLDSSYEENHNVLDVKARNIAFGNYALALDVDSGDFHSYRTITDEEAATFDSLSFVPSVLDQAAELIRTPKTGFTLSGSVLDNEGLGIALRGNGKFDNTENVKAGFGVLYLDQYKYHAGQIWTTHKIALDVDNHVAHAKDEPNENLVKFAYNNDNHSEKVEGQVKIQSLTDIVDIVMTFIDEAKDDIKFKKFVAPITELLGVSQLTSIIENRDYVRLAGDEVVKSISQFDENGQQGLRIIVGGTLFGLNTNNPIRIDVLFDADSKISGLKVIDLVLGSENAKTINLNLDLKDYNSSSIDPAQIDRSKNYMPLDGIKTLLEVGINTTKNNFYHLTADITASTKVVLDLELALDCYIKVEGERVKVYGTIEGIPCIAGVSQDYEVLYSTAHMSEFTFETYSDNSEDKVGGYFNIRRRTDIYTSILGLFKSYSNTKVKHYKTDSKNFLDNIVDYLLGTMVGLSKGTVGLVGSIDLGGDEKAAGNFGKSLTSTGFNMTTTGNGANTVHTITAGFNLDELTGVSALRGLELTISTKRSDGVDILYNAVADLEIVALTTITLHADIKLEDASVSNSDIWSPAESVFNEITTRNFTATLNDPYSAMSYQNKNLRFSDL